MYVFTNTMIYHGPYTPTVLKNIVSLFVDLKITQLLFDLIVLFSQLGSLLHVLSNSSQYRKFWMPRLGTLLKLVGI